MTVAQAEHRQLGSRTSIPHCRQVNLGWRLNLFQALNAKIAEQKVVAYYDKQRKAAEGVLAG